MRLYNAQDTPVQVDLEGHILEGHKAETYSEVNEFLQKQIDQGTLIVQPERVFEPSPALQEEEQQEEAEQQVTEGQGNKSSASTARSSKRASSKKKTATKKQER